MSILSAPASDLSTEQVSSKSKLETLIDNLSKAEEKLKNSPTGEILINDGYGVHKEDNIVCGALNSLYVRWGKVHIGNYTRKVSPFGVYFTAEDRKDLEKLTGVEDAWLEWKHKQIMDRTFNPKEWRIDHSITIFDGYQKIILAGDYLTIELNVDGMYERRDYVKREGKIIQTFSLRGDKSNPLLISYSYLESEARDDKFIEEALKLAQTELRLL